MNVTKQRLMDYVIIETIISIFFIFFFNNYHVFGSFSFNKLQINLHMSFFYCTFAASKVKGKQDAKSGSSKYDPEDAAFLCVTAG